MWQLPDRRNSTSMSIGSLPEGLGISASMAFAPATKPEMRSVLVEGMEASSVRMVPPFGLGVVLVLSCYEMLRKNFDFNCTFCGRTPSF